MEGGPGGFSATNAINAQQQWSVREAKTFVLSCQELSLVVLPALQASCTTVVETDPYRWRGSVRRELSVFDQCDVTIGLTRLEEEATSTVDVEVSFEPTLGRLVTAAFLGMTVVGIPVALGWRALSVRSSRDFSRKLMTEIWDGIENPATAGAYRGR